MSHKGAFELSADARLLIQHLEGVEEGQEITYETLSNVIGRDVRNQAYGQLCTARKRLLDDGIVFETVRGIGIRRMTASEIANTVGLHSIKRIQRESKRGLRRLSCAAMGNLTNEDIIKMNTSASVLGVVAEFSKTKSVHTIEGHIAETDGKELPIGKSLELFT